MSRKKRQEHVNHERWLVSYADFITLLFAFFVVLFASSQSDKKKQTKLASAMQAAFSTYGIFEPRSTKLPLAAGETVVSSSVSTLDEQSRAAVPALTRPEAGVLRKAVDRIVSSSGLRGAVTVRHTQEGEVLSLHEAAFFDTGDAALRASAIPLLRQLAGMLPYEAPIRVEGHTDTVPVHNELFKSNWELSTERANSVARVLMERGLVAPSRISVAGYAEYRPIASNLTEEGRKQNRRVDIVVLRSTPSMANAELTAKPASQHPAALR